MSKAAEREKYMRDPTSMTELRDRLAVVWGSLFREEMEIGRAKELANVAGKIIKSTVAQYEYAALRKETPDIPFLK